MMAEKPITRFGLLQLSVDGIQNVLEYGQHGSYEYWLEP